jgi:hypothetical protein
MTESFVEAKGKCAKCGGDLHTIEDNPTKDSIVVCKLCGAEIGTRGEINSQLREAAIGKAQEIRDVQIAQLKRQLGNKTIKIKIG